MASSSSASEKLKHTDLYALFGVPSNSTTEIITKAYRKKALTVHPDKNPDNPKAAEMFVLLTEALKILTDVSARSAYDQVQKAKEAAEKRNQQLDSKRRKLKEDLEAREREAVSSSARNVFQKAAQPQTPTQTSESKLEQEILRLRKEGNRLVEMEQERLREELRKQMAASSISKPASKPDESGCRLKIRWKVDKKDTTNAGVNQDFLKTLFSQYGSLNFVVLNNKKSGSAIIEYQNPMNAKKAMEAENGRMFEMSYIDRPPEERKPSAGPFGEPNRQKGQPETRPVNTVPARPMATSLDELEAMVFAQIDASMKRKSDGIA